MLSFLRRYRRTLFLSIVVVFLIGIFVGLGGYLFTSRDTFGTVAVVGSTKIPYNVFLRRVNQILDVLKDKGTEVNDNLIKEVKQDTLRDMIVDELLYSKALELGLVVTDDELARDIRNTPAFQSGGAFDQSAYFQSVYRIYRDTPKAYEEMRHKSLMTMKLKQLIFQAAKYSPEDLQEAYALENKGTLADFDKNKASFEQKLRQARALELINYYLRQISAQVEIRSFLAEREAGA